MKKLIYIIIFGFLGGALREWLTLLAGNDHFAMIIAINLVGTFLLAFVVSTLPLWVSISADLLSGLSVGFIGSFTTFSTFTVDTIKLMRSNPVGAFWYLAISLVCGYLLARLGVQLANHLIAKAGEQ